MQVSSYASMSIFRYTSCFLKVKITSIYYSNYFSNVKVLLTLYFKMSLYNVYIHSTQTDIFQVFISFNFDDYK